MCVDYSVSQDSERYLYLFRSAVSDSKERTKEKEQLRKKSNSMKKTSETDNTAMAT